MRTLTTSWSQPTQVVVVYLLLPAPRSASRTSLLEWPVISSVNFVPIGHHEEAVFRLAGKVIAFSSAPSSGTDGTEDTSSNSKSSKSKDRSESSKERGDKKIRALRSELEKLHAKVARALHSIDEAMSTLLQRVVCRES